MSVKKYVLFILLFASYQYVFSQNYFPLNVGDKWYFENKPFSIDSTKQIGDFIYYKVPSRYYGHNYFRKDYLGNVYRNFNGIDTLIYKFNAEIGETWSIPGEDYVDYEVEMISKNDSVIIWGDTLLNCVKLFLRGTNAFDADMYYWFAENIGLVKMESTVWGSTYELNKGVFGGVRYPANKELLILESTNPYDTQTNIPIDANILISFNYKIRPEFLSEQYFYVTYGNGQTIDGNFDYNHNPSSTIIFEPANNFKFGADIIVSISSEVSDFINDSLNSNFIFQFTIEEQSEPQDVFTLTDTIALDYSNNYWGKYKLKDFNNDNKIDLAFAHVLTGADSIFIWENQGSNFSLFDKFATETSTSTTQDCVINWIDINNDKKEDILFSSNTSYQNSIIKFYLNTGYDFKFFSSFDLKIITDEVDIADYNNDSLDDVLISSLGNYYSKDTLYIIKNMGNNFNVINFQIPYEINYSKAFWVDIDADGDLDIILISNDLSKIRFLIQTPDGFLPWNKMCYESNYIYPTSVLAMDFDADGDIDIYVDGYLLEQTESEFIVNSNIKKLLFSKAVFSDYNNDSYPELFIIGIGEDPVGREYDYVNIYSNNNGDYFLKDNFKTPIEGMRTSFWHDFDQNGSPDLIYYDKKKVYFFANEKYITNVDKRNILISDFSLSQNYPNPFNPTTTIKFTIPSVETPYRASLHTKLRVYDILGREVKTLINKQLQPGEYEVQFDGSNLPSGVYLYRLTASEYIKTRKMVLIR